VAWSAIRFTVESQLFGVALILLASARAWEDVDTSNALAAVFVVGIAGLFVALLALELVMVRAGHSRAENGPPAEPPRVTERALT
jgi:hypothetical protein